jgi:stearoyl-CoA desaturase (delta-9 desaturase)
VATIHVLALLALVPALFSWTGLILALVGLYVFGTLGINLCYHRLLAHQSFRCSTWLERGLALLGVCCLQDSPARWVAIHRYHHQFSDQEKDPHSPLVNFCWSHFGWVFVCNREFTALNLYDRYARDLLRQRFYFQLEKNLNWVWVYLIHAALFYFAGTLIGWLSTGDVMAGTMFGLSLLVWGVLVRTVLVWHITWSVNSLTHMFGYQSFATGENSRNNWLVGVITNGEGWHNNHHAYPRSAAHGLRWWELDVTYLTIRLLKLVGLAWEVSLPRYRERDLEEPAREAEPALVSTGEAARDE